MRKILNHTLMLMERSAVGFEITGIIMLFRLAFRVIDDQTLLVVVVLGSVTILPELLMLRLPKLVGWFWNYANQRYAVYSAVYSEQVLNDYLGWFSYNPWYEEVHVSNACIVILGIFAMHSQYETVCLAAYFAIPVGILALWWLIGNFYGLGYRYDAKVRVTKGTIQVLQDQSCPKRVRVLPYLYRRQETGWVWVKVSELDFSQK